MFGDYPPNNWNSDPVEFGGKLYAAPCTGPGFLVVDLPVADPSPATHATLMVWKAGDSVFQTLSLTKNSVSYTYRWTATVSSTFWRPNTVWNAFRPAFNERGLRC